jgi:hypothetical protein
LGFGAGGLGLGVLGMGPNPQSPIPNPQSPIPNPQLMLYFNKKFNINLNLTLINYIIIF